MQYTQKVMDHFKNPHNQGKIEDAEAVGQEGNLACGDVMKIYLKVKNNIIEDVKFETFGCAAAIAVSSALTDRVKGKTLNEALKITKDEIVDDLGGLPPVKIHCSMLGVDALRKAIENYKFKKYWKENQPDNDPYANNKKKLSASRKKVLKIADYIIPGHGDIYKVNK